MLSLCSHAQPRHMTSDCICCCRIERRGQVLLDLKRFEEAIADFDDAETGYHATVDPKYVSLGLLSNRALAYEGLYQWAEALRDYNDVRTHPRHQTSIQVLNTRVTGCY